jgi:hypothetical protein
MARVPVRAGACLAPRLSPIKAAVSSPLPDRQLAPKEKAMTEAFWVDHDYDRENASDGVSRYGAYVRDRDFDPWTDQDQHVELAVFAWQVATTPVMSPGYVRRHPRIARAALERSDWDGSLIALVDLVMPQPRHLSYLRSDDDRGCWRDWPSEYSFATGTDNWFEPVGEDLARDPYLLCTASLRFTVPPAGLAKLPGTPERAAACGAVPRHGCRSRPQPERHRRPRHRPHRGELTDAAPR